MKYLTKCSLKSQKMGFIVCSYQKKVLPLSSLNAHSRIIQLVPWMSGLVSGLQNRVRRFESARHLKEFLTNSFFYFIYYCL